MNWQQKEVWVQRGEHFWVEVVHWFSEAFISANYHRPRAERWNIYAYLRPEHPMFKLYADTTDYYPDDYLDMHWGPTWFRTKYDKEGKVLYYEVGCDYAHCDDERFERARTKEEAWEVFQDAEGIFNQLKEAK